MKNVVVIALCLGVLWACSKPVSEFNSFEHAQQQLKELNFALLPESSGDNSDELVFPFTESYLEKRHQIYQGLKDVKLNETQQQQLNYLIIAERYPERFFPWPAVSNVLANVQSRQATSTIKMSDWLQFVEDRLKQAEQSKLRLNKRELQQLQTMLANFKEHKTDNMHELESLTTYLSHYQPRAQIGLIGLANGKAWYQSKLNYYTGSSQDPLNWLSLVQQKLKAYKALEMPIEFSSFDFSKPLALAYLVSDSQQGLDWQLNYIDPKTSKEPLQQAEQYFWLVMMETDIGIHYHAWTLLQAKQNLVRRLAVDQRASQQLVDDIIFYPAMSFIFLDV